MDRYDFYPPHGHPDHDCTRATALWLEANTNGFDADTDRIVGQFCLGEGVDLEDGTDVHHAHGLLVARGDNAREWNRDDPAYLQAMLDGLKPPPRRQQRQPGGVPAARGQARWN